MEGCVAKTYSCSVSYDIDNGELKLEDSLGQMFSISCNENIDIEKHKALVNDAGTQLTAAIDDLLDPSVEDTFAGLCKHDKDGKKASEKFANYKEALIQIRDEVSRFCVPK